MFSVNGVELENAALGWRLMAATLPVTGLTNSIWKSITTGRDGHKAQPTVRHSTAVKFEVLTPTENWETLMALFASPTLTITQAGVTGRTLTGMLKSSSDPKHYPRSGVTSTVFFVEVPDGCWRGTEVTTSLTAAAPAGATMTLFSGLSAPVQDSIVRFKGPIQDAQVLDPSGAFVTVSGTVPSGQFVRFESDTGRAWLTTSDTWSGGTEVSGQIDFGGPRGVFEITPQFTTPGSPGSRSGSLSLSQASYNTGAGFQVRGRPAYLS